MPISGGAGGRGEPGHRGSADRVVALGAELRALHDAIMGATFRYEERELVPVLDASTAPGWFSPTASGSVDERVAPGGGSRE